MRYEFYGEEYELELKMTSNGIFRIVERSDWAEYWLWSSLGVAGYGSRILDRTCQRAEAAGYDPILLGVNKNTNKIQLFLRKRCPLFRMFDLNTLFRL
jgi:hypothetical protein